MIKLSKSDYEKILHHAESELPNEACGLIGGRLLFLIIEAVRRKPVKPEHEGMVHAIGMAALLLLMVVVTVSDIIKLV